MNNKKSSDEKIISAYEQHYSNLYRFCNVKLKNITATEDCVQECFLILYKHYRERDEISNVAGFLYKTADNLIKTQWRKAKREMDYIPLDDVEETVFVEKIEYPDLDYDEIANEIISSLNESDYQLYKLKYIEKKKIKDISAELQISFEATAKRLSRLREKVRDIIENMQKGDINCDIFT